MRGHKLVKEEPHQLHIMSPDGKVFQVAKHALSLPMLTELAKMPKHMDEGGEAEESDPSGKYAGEYAAAATAEGREPEYLKGKDPGEKIPDSEWQKTGIGTDPFNAKFGYGGAPSSSGEAQAAPQEGVPQTEGAPLASAENQRVSSFNEAPPAIKPPGSEPYDYLQDVQGISDRQKGALQAQADAQKGLAKQQFDVATKQQAAMADQQKLFNAHMMALDNDNAQLEKAYKEGKVNPNRIFDNAGIVGSLAMIAGVIVGGIGGGGTHNMALDTLNKSIDRDIESQKADLGKTDNLLHMNLQKHNNLMAAENATRLNMMASYKGMLDAAAAKAGGPEAQARADMAKSQIDMQMSGIKQQTAMIKAAQSQFAPIGPSGNVAGGVDPQRFRAAVALGAHGLPGGIPKDQVASVSKEYEDYGKLRGAVDNVQDAFTKVDKAQTLSNRVGNPMQSMKDIDATKKIFSAQLAKDLEGRATPQDIDSIMENFPNLTDSEATRQSKQANLISSIKAKYGSFPMLQSYNLLHSRDPYITSSGQAKRLAQENFK